MLKKPLTDPPACASNILAMLDTLDVLGGKWKLLIIHYLMIRPNELNTFNKIKNDIGGISAKMLSQELKALETNRIIIRKELDTRPITVQYSLSGYGNSVNEVIRVLVNWGQNHRQKLFELPDN